MLLLFKIQSFRCSEVLGQLALCGNEKLSGKDHGPPQGFGSGLTSDAGPDTPPAKQPVGARISPVRSAIDISEHRADVMCQNCNRSRLNAIFANMFKICHPEREHTDPKPAMRHRALLVLVLWACLDRTAKQQRGGRSLSDREQQRDDGSKVCQPG